MKTLETALPLTPAQCGRTAERCLRLEIADDYIDVLIDAAAGEESCLYCRIAIDRTSESRVKAVEELVYANPLLLCDFGKVTVLIRSHDAELVPQGFGPWRDVKEGCETLVDDVPGFGVQAVCPADSQVLKFVRRTFNGASVHGHLAVMCDYLAKDRRRSNRAKTYLQLNDRYADVIIIDHDGLKHAVTYSISSPLDAVYFTLAAMLSVSFDRNEGELMVYGQPELRRRVLAPLRKYVNSVMPLIVPADFCQDAPLELNCVFG